VLLNSSSASVRLPREPAVQETSYKNPVLNNNLKKNIVNKYKSHAENAERMMMEVFVSPMKYTAYPV